jgi:class 3 adenylate cyclase/tetratricopeptide (TPR) repeat protein
VAPNTDLGGAREPASVVRQRHHDAQRRQITVMFCDLVGSTTLSGRLDPEDFREVLGLYQEVAVEAIERYSGYVTQLLGDGVVACFGYPKAHEDDAQRAVYAGLDIVVGLGDLSARTKSRFDASLEVRIGCHTGLVVAGAMEAGSRRDEFAMVGETPNIAARLQAVAAPGSLVVSEVTQGLIQGYFETESLGQRTLPGVSRPILVYRVLRSTGVEHRLDLFGSERMTPLVDRAVEIELLQAAWRGVQHGRGTLAQVSGEPGIGKSRLVHALADCLGDELAVAQRWQCSRHHQSSALYPVIRQLESRYELEPGEQEAVQLQKLADAVVGAGADGEPALPLLIDLLPLSSGRPQRDRLADAQEERTRLLHTLQALLVADPAQHPMLLLVEDLQWADPTTLELLWRVLNDLPTLPVLCVVTYRPDFSWPWRRMPGLQIDLGPLAAEHVRELARAVTDGAVEEGVMDRVRATAGGIPLFIEEMLKMLALEEPGEGPGPHLSEPALPVTLHGLLTERLDRLSDLGEVLDVAAVIGREFDRDLLQALDPMGGTDLELVLAKLTAQDILCQLDGPTVCFEFRHALLHEAAYLRVLRRRRQELHARVATMLVGRFAERAEREPEVVAHHWSSAGMPAKAAGYWRAAGLRALEQAAFVEAAEHFRRGLEALDQTEPDAGTEERRADFLTHLGAALQAGQGYAAAGVDDAYVRARERWQTTGDDERLLAVVRGQSMSHLVAADFDATDELARQLLELAQQRGSSASLAESHLYAGLVHMYRGELQLACEHLEQAISAHQWPERVDQVYEALGSTGAGAHAYLASVLSNMGHERESLAHSDRSLELAERVDRPVTRAQVWFMRAILHLGRSELDEFSEWVERARGFSVDRNIRYWRTLASAYSNWARGMLRDREEGIAQLEASIDSYLQSGARLGLAYLHVLLANLQLDVGALTDALATVGRGQEHMVRTGERLAEVDLLGCKARVLVAGAEPDNAAAIATLQQAVEVGERQGARLPQLRVLRALVLRRRRAGEDSSGDEQRLAELCSRFESDSQLADLLRARAIVRPGAASG